VIGKFWRGLSYEAKSALAALAVVLVVAAGFFAAAGLTSLESSASDVEAEAVLVETLTVERVLTSTGGGERTVVRTVRVVPRVTESAGVLGTAVELRTITTPGPRDLVTVPGAARTIVETRGGVTRTSVVTNERVVTDRRVVTNERVVTDRRVVTNERLVTTDRVVTNDRTITDVRTQQVTVPVTTVRTVTEPVTVTQTVTTTEVSTETVIPPPETVTVTCPPKGCG
jgi:hypothetical protein